MQKLQRMGDERDSYMADREHSAGESAVKEQTEIQFKNDLDF